jgi:hypothetical protein
VSQAACSYSWIRPPSRPCGVAAQWVAPGLRDPRRRRRHRGRFARRRDKRHTLIKATLGSGGLVEIGEPERTFTVEPLEDPVARELPAQPAESPATPSPVEEPIEPERAGTP